jgi:hypothetical protein
MSILNFTIVKFLMIDHEQTFATGFSAVLEVRIRAGLMLSGIQLTIFDRRNAAAESIQVSDAQRVFLIGWQGIRRRL